MAYYNRWQFRKNWPYNSPTPIWMELQALERKRHYNRMVWLSRACVVIGGISMLTAVYLTNIEPMFTHLHHMLAIIPPG
jgi:hypothetical protein